jgi:hypothetical protein
MQAHLDLKMRKVEPAVPEVEREGVRDHLRRIWSVITKYVTYDKDALFKDPNWPHLWS